MDSDTIRCIFDAHRSSAICSISHSRWSAIDDANLVIAAVSVVSLGIATYALIEQRRTATRERWAALYHTLIVEPVSANVTRLFTEVTEQLNELESVVRNAKISNGGVNDLEAAIGAIAGQYRARSSAFQARVLMYVSSWNDSGFRADVLGALLELQDKVEKAISSYRGGGPEAEHPQHVFEAALSEMNKAVLFFDIGSPRLHRASKVTRWRATLRSLAR